MTKQAAQIVPLSSVNRSLQQRDNKGIVRAIANLTPVKLIQRRADYNDSLFRLQELQNSLVFFEQEYNEADKEKHLKSIKEEIEQATAALAQTSYSPYLYELAKEDYDEAVDSIEFMLLNTIEYFDVPKDTIIQRTSELAVEILEKYKSMTIDDVAICLRMAKDGDFGELYHRLDGMIVKKWFKAYWETLCAIKTEKHESLHSSTSQSRSAGFMQEVQAKIAAVMNRVRTINYDLNANNSEE